jgi:hypothetical protein
VSEAGVKRTYTASDKRMIMLLIVVGFRGPLQNHMILGNLCSCTESFDVFSWSKDLVLMDIIKFTGQDRFYGRNTYGQLGGSLLWTDRTRDQDLQT